MIKINQGLQTIDQLRFENFNLKKQIAYDKKKYIDLKNAFLELKVKTKAQDEETFFKNPELKQLMDDKNNLQNTLKILTDEVEFLSKKNELFLKELKHKDFYDVYKQQAEELTKLREAHTSLINMIQTKDIQVKALNQRSSLTPKVTSGNIFSRESSQSSQILN